LHQEPGSEEVATLLTQAAMSSVNLSEVIAKLAAVGLSETGIGRATDGLGVALSPLIDPKPIQQGFCTKAPSLWAYR